uniref:COX assembly mitochondrial protein n=1 Tax=Balaenoptera musculus TaxID=9771 RepID=A0A8C0CQ45_BALMU
MREKARERCSEQVQDFTKCCKDSGILVVVKCQKENSALKECLTAYYNDPAFHEECKMEYLKESEEFRKTGIPTYQEKAEEASHKHVGKYSNDTQERQCSWKSQSPEMMDSRKCVCFILNNGNNFI